MTWRRGMALGALALLAFGSGHARAETGAAGLLPYQMVRSLQLVQDRIAGGDHAALPMQKKLLEMVDARFRNAGNDEFEDHRNFQAMMIYAMSGGNPATIADLLARMEIDEVDRAAGAGVLGYLTGNVAQARDAMAGIDPARYSPELAAFLALVKGSVVAGEDAAAGMAMLDEARLAAPGTLVEEAALRRTIALASGAGDAEKFMSASEQYARRFLRSPYASQYAESFVSGMITLDRGKLDLHRIEQTVDWMTREQAHTVYLRLARKAAIDGDAELLAFATRHTAGEDGEAEKGLDPRSELYSSISSVTSETVEQVLSRLEGLDSTQLSSRDRALLTAARTVAAEVVAPVEATTAPPLWLEDYPIEEAAAPDQPLDEADELVASTRTKLDAIDKMLEETKR